MATTYQHGTYGYLAATQAQSAAQSGTIPVYIGTAPVNLVRGYKPSGLVNSPVKLGNWTQAQRAIGYSSDWETYTLCEAADVHFNNVLGNCGPVYVINVLDPDVHRKAEQTTKALTFTNGRAEFLSDSIILDTLAIADKAEGVDYALDYNYTRGTVIITLTDTSVTSANVTYFEVDPAQLTLDDIVGGQTEGGVYTGIGAVELVYLTDFHTPTLLAAPGWSHNPAVYNALVAKAQGINGKWIAFVLADIPVSEASSRVEAINWKRSHGYTSKFSKACWPMGQDATGRKYHISTVAVWLFQTTDAANNGIPGESCSNKAVPFVRQYFGEDSTNKGFDQIGGNELNEKGITTIIPSNGNWVLWGPHTAAFEFGVTSDALEVFDTYVRMQSHCVNSFMKEWAPRIDKPMTLQLRDEILNRENDKLQGYVAQGFLVGNPQCLFLSSDNETTDLINGDFKWNITSTPTPPFKSGTVGVAYTDAGLSVYTQGTQS